MRSDAGETERLPIEGLGPPSSDCHRENNSGMFAPEVWAATLSSRILEPNREQLNARLRARIVRGREPQGAGKSAYF
jgi:hypothetical protein